MKKQMIFWIIIVCLLLSACGIGFAGVVGSPHDLTSKGPDSNVCSYCHVPHNAAGIKIWSTYGNESQLTNGPSSVIGNLCYTCHDGTITSRGQSTVFNASLQQHWMSSGSFYDCNMCHTVHDNTNGKFMRVAKSGGTDATEKATYCQTCHSGEMRFQIDGGNWVQTDYLGDHLSGHEHPYKDSGNLLDESCYSCHQIHGAANYSSANVANPILKSSNADSAFCGTCHADHVQNITGGNKHPANLSSAGAWGKVTCEGCHDVHQPWGQEGHAYILRGDNIESGFCTTCHQASGAVNAPNIGDHSHPVQVPFTVTPTDPSAAPAANLIDDNNLNGPDYPNNSASMVCESCHSVHLKGVASPLLRKSSDAGALCVNCHTGK